MKNFCNLAMILCLSCITLSLTSCGKISAPAPLEGSGYPHSYPRK